LLAHAQEPISDGLPPVHLGGEMELLMLAGLVALIVTAGFTGAAIYVSVAEQPARLKLDDHAMLAEWQPSYRRGAAMQGGLAVVAFLLGLIAWWQTGLTSFIAGAILIILPWPWTVFVMLPTNKRLEATKPAQAGAETRELIVKWGRMHLVRLALGVLATLAYLWAVMP
jgi:hypothetical protein